MSEVLTIISEVVIDFGKIFLLLGAICAIISGFWAFLSVRTRQRHRRSQLESDYSDYIWPGESYFQRYGCFVLAIFNLVMTAIVFSLTFMTASIAAAMLMLIFLKYSLSLCLAIFIPVIIVSGCLGAFGGHLADKSEQRMMECAEIIAQLRSLDRRSSRTRRSISHRTRLIR